MFLGCHGIPPVPLNGCIVIQNFIIDLLCELGKPFDTFQDRSGNGSPKCLWGKHPFVCYDCGARTKPWRRTGLAAVHHMPIFPLIVVRSGPPAVVDLCGKGDNVVWVAGHHGREEGLGENMFFGPRVGLGWAWKPGGEKRRPDGEEEGWSHLLIHTTLYKYHGILLFFIRIQHSDASQGFQCVEVPLANRWVSC